MSSPTRAAHVLGKLLNRVGEDRVLWGTDAIWYGSPQPQIMAFRAFQITPEFQQRFGYPALTDTSSGRSSGSTRQSSWASTPTQPCAPSTRACCTTARAEYTSLSTTGEVSERWAARGAISRRDVIRLFRLTGGPSL